MVVAGVILLCAAADAQTVTVDARQVAAQSGDPGQLQRIVWETHVAAGQNEVMAVYVVGPRGGTTVGARSIGFALRTGLSGVPSWTEGLIPDDSAGNPITGPGGIQFPATSPDKNLYVAHFLQLRPNQPPGRLRFAVGKDAVDPDDAKVEFFRIKDPNDVPVKLTLNHPIVNNPPDPPLAPGTFRIPTIPEIAIDPDDANSMYLVYSDTATSSPSDKDMNIYFHKLTKQDSSGVVWTLGPRIGPINDDSSAFESDQVMPTITVANGRIHVVWYDDRKYNETSNQADGAANPKYDVFYASSTDAVTFSSNEELFANPSETALDLSLTTTLSEMGDYIGVSAFGDTVYALYTGTKQNAPGDDSVIYSTRIEHGQ